MSNVSCIEKPTIYNFLDISGYRRLKSVDCSGEEL